MAFKWPYATDKFTSYEGDKRITRLSVALWLIDDYAKKEPIGNVSVKIKKPFKKEAFKNPSGYYIFTDLADGSYTVGIESDLYFPEERTFDISKVKTLDVTLKFDGSGPVTGATSTKLIDVSKLQKDDVVEFHNPAGEVERKFITNIDEGARAISWLGGLKHDFSAADSMILALRNPIIEVPLKPLTSYLFPAHATLIRGLILDSNKLPEVVAVVNADVNAVSQNTCLFDWNKIPEDNENKKLINFLTQNYSIDWVKKAKIEKIGEGNAIRVFTEKKCLSLRLNDEKTGVNLKIDDDRADEFIAKKRDDKLNIYKSIKNKSNESGEFVLYFDRIKDKKTLLFNWDKVPDDDSENKKFINFLTQNYGIDWVMTAEIEKIDEGNAIRAYTEDHSLSLRLNNEKIRVMLTIDDGRTEEFVVKEKNDMLNIYKKIIIEIEKNANTKNIETTFEEGETIIVGTIAFP